MYIEKVFFKSSAHEKWGQKLKCCIYNLVQCIFVSREEVLLLENVQMKIVLDV